MDNKSRRIEFWAALKAAATFHAAGNLSFTDALNDAKAALDYADTEWPIDSEEVKPDLKYVAEPKSKEQYQGHGEIEKPRKPFQGKDGAMMYPTECASCGSPSYSRIEGQKSKTCKNCRQ